MNDAESMDDAELLRRFAAERSEASFAELVRRRAGLVMDIALRTTTSRVLAEEIVQNVFLSLARKASRVAGSRVVIAWLHRAALLESRAVLRAENRRRKHLSEAALMITQPLTPPDPRMMELLQSLDEALDSLPLAEREILLRHYYDRQSYQEAGLRLGTSEAGARQLAARARKRLAAWFGRRGRDVSVSGVSTLLAGHLPASLNSSQATLAASVARAVVSFAAPNPAPILSAFLKYLPSMKLPVSLCLLAGFLMTFLPGIGRDPGDAATTPNHDWETVRHPPEPARRYKPAVGAGRLAEGFDIDLFEKEVATVVQLSKDRRLGFNVRATSAMGVTAGFDLSYGRQMELARLVMNQPISNMPALLAACQRCDPDARGGMVLEAVFARWAEGDPAAARAALLGLGRTAQDYAMHGICITLINRDVEAAAREALSIPTQIQAQYFDGSRLGFIQNIVHACQNRNPQATLQACLDGPELLAGQMVEQVLSSWIQADPTAAAEWFGKVCASRPVPGNGRAERRCVEMLRQEHPELAGRFVDSLPAGSLRDSVTARLHAASSDGETGK